MSTKVKAKTMSQESILSRKAVLVKLNVSCEIGYSMVDKKATEEIDEKHGATKAGRFVKHLYQPDDLKEIFDAIVIARKAHARYTLKWLDSGIRILPISVFSKHDAEVKRAETALQEAIDRFLSDYEEIVERNKIRLGDLASDTYYSKERFRSGLRMWVSYFPMPVEDDFKFEANASIVSSVKSQFSESLKEYEYRAKTEVAERLGVAVKRLFDRLDDADKKVKDGMLSKLVSLLNDLKDLNVTEDPNINELIASAEASFAKESAEFMTENADYRAKKKKEAEEIITKLTKAFPRALEF